MAGAGGGVEVPSFEAWARARSGALLGTAYLLTADHDAAQDLVQEALARVFVRWRRIRSSPDGYARQTLVNLAVDRHRLRRGREVEWTEDASPRLRDHAEVCTERAAVIVALRGLSKQQRAAVVLRYLEDLSEAQTADALRCSVGTVKSHTSRGLAKLRAALAERDESTTPTVCDPGSAS